MRFIENKTGNQLEVSRKEYKYFYKMADLRIFVPAFVYIGKLAKHDLKWGN